METLIVINDILIATWYYLFWKKRWGQKTFNFNHWYRYSESFWERGFWGIL